MNRLMIPKHSLETLLHLIHMWLPKSRIGAFGSRIDGTAHSGSDLDLVILTQTHTREDFIAFTNAVEESALPFLVDVSEMHRLPESFQDEIQRDYVVVYDGNIDN